MPPPRRRTPKTVTYTKRTAEHVVDSVRRIDGQYYPYTRLYWPAVLPGGFSTTAEAIVTTQIGACSSLIYGQGQAQIYLNNNGTAMIDQTYPDPVTVLNWLLNTGTIVAGKHVIIAKRSDYWLLVSGDC